MLDNAAKPPRSRPPWQHCSGPSVRTSVHKPASVTRSRTTARGTARFSSAATRSGRFSTTRGCGTGEAWTQVEDVGPSGRAGHAVAFDSGRSRAVLFGGRNANPLSDTWEWDGSAWTQVEDTGPSARSGHAVAYDSARSRVVLFGGRGAGDVLLGDTWEWNGDEWTQVADTGPSPRAGHAVCFDADGARTVLFGGAATSDTWAWSGSTWTALNDVGPGPCEGTGLVFTGQSVILFGGVDPAQNPAALFGLTWEFAGTDWTERQDIGPAPRHRHAMAYDTQRGRVVMFGGNSAPPATATAADLLADTWELPAGGQGQGGLDGQGGGQGMATLVSFSLVPDTAGDGQTVTIEIVLDQAPTVDTVVSLAVDGSPAGDVTVPAGQASASVTFPSNALPNGTYTFTATLGSVTLAATFTRQ